MGPLPLFSPIHQFILIGILGIWIIIPYIGTFFSKDNSYRIGVILAITIISLEIFLFIFRISNDLFNPSNNFPLHLCSFSEFCAAYALITRNQRAFELSFYWGFAGATQALLTPHLVGYSLFDTQFNIFFISHGLIILNVLWLLVVYKMKIRSVSFKEVIIVSNLLIIPIGLIDWIGNANYMYLRFKPNVDNILLMGDWPWYILGIEFISIILFGLLFLIMKLINKVSPKPVI